MTEPDFTQERVRFLLGVFEGAMPNGDLVGHAIYAGPDSTPEALERVSELGVRGLGMKYLGVQDVHQVGDWRLSVMYLDDDDETTEEA